MDQKACVDNVDPAEIKPERRKMPEAEVTEQESSKLRGPGERCNGLADRHKKSLCRQRRCSQSSLPTATVGVMQLISILHLKHLNSGNLQA